MCALTNRAVRLGKSGLRISQIVLGTMQYGDKGWQEWALGEEEAVEHIKYACAHIPVLIRRRV